MLQKQVLLKNNPSSDSSNKTKIAFLWESKELNGSLIKFPPGFDGIIESNGEIFHAITISGESIYTLPKSKEKKSLDPGSYFTSKGKAIHQISTKPKMESVIYCRTNGNFIVRQ